MLWKKIGVLLLNWDKKKSWLTIVLVEIVPAAFIFCCLYDLWEALPQEEGFFFCLFSKNNRYVAKD